MIIIYISNDINYYYLFLPHQKALSLTRWPFAIASLPSSPNEPIERLFSLILGLVVPPPTTKVPYLFPGSYHHLNLSLRAHYPYHTHMMSNCHPLTSQTWILPPQWKLKPRTTSVGNVWQTQDNSPGIFWWAWLGASDLTRHFYILDPFFIYFKIWKKACAT